MLVICPHCGHEFYTPTQARPGIETPLSAARVRKGLSLNGAARDLGLSVRMLGRIEKGKTMPRLDIVRRISVLYGEPIEDLWPPSSPDGDEVEEGEEGETRVVTFGEEDEEREEEPDGTVEDDEDEDE